MRELTAFALSFLSLRARAQIITKARGKPKKYAVADAASIQPGKMKTVKIDGRDVLLIRVRFERAGAT